MTDPVEEIQNHLLWEIMILAKILRGRIPVPEMTAEAETPAEEIPRVQAVQEGAAAEALLSREAVQEEAAAEALPDQAAAQEEAAEALPDQAAAQEEAAAQEAVRHL